MHAGLNRTTFRCSLAYRTVQAAQLPSRAWVVGHTPEEKPTTALLLFMSRNIFHTYIHNVSGNKKS